MNRLRALLSPLTLGIAAAAVGFVLLALPGLMAAALGLECVAFAFWIWARQGHDRRDALARWAWLRRPAMALWLAAALAAVLPAPHTAPPAATAATSHAGLAVVLETPDLSPAPTATSRDPLGALRVLGALAILWAGLELLAALPTSRPYPDFHGPLPQVGAWLTGVLPAAGFLVLWRQAQLWTGVPLVREFATIVLVFAAGLAVLRAYSRRTWTASLRWLAVFDSAMAAALIALDTVPHDAVLLLWFAAAGGRLTALATELRGSAGRRGAWSARLWRIAGFTASACLSWPLLIAVGFPNGHFRPLEFLLVAAPVFLATALSLRRVVEVPERRAMARPDATRVPSLVGAALTLLLGPSALLLAWWEGLEYSFPGVLVAIVPALLAAWPRTWLARETDLPPVLRASVAAGATARDFALSVYRSVLAFESRAAEALTALLRALGAPARDLHTGDAQEYLLFLVGVSVLALLLPLLR